MKTLREQGELAAAAAAEQLARDDFNATYAPDGERDGIELTEWGPVAGQFADWATTTVALERSGLREGNSLMRRVVQHPVLFLAVKVGAGAAMGKAIDRLNDEAGRARLRGDHVTAAKKERWARRASVFFTVLGAGAAVNNAVQIARRS